MSGTNPKPGMILAYRYLWAAEYEAGHERGLKLRPCLVLGVEPILRGYRVTVVPITHYPQMDRYVEVPTAYLRQAGLDGHGQYVVVAEANVFRWPSFDARGELGSIPEGFFKEVRQVVQQEAKHLRSVDYEEMEREVVEGYRNE